MQEKIAHEEKEMETKAQKRQIPFIQKKILDEQLKRAAAKKIQLVSDLHALESDIKNLKVTVKGQTLSTQTSVHKSNTNSKAKMNKQKYTCIICSTGIKEILFLPCKHMIVCRVCNKTMIKSGIEHCIQCQEYIVQRHNVYWGNFVQAKGGQIILNEEKKLLKGEGGEIVLE